MILGAVPEPSITASLRAQPPGLHGSGDEYWGLAWPALEWLEREVRPGMATLETGSGSSTIVFAAGGADHEAVTPDATEEERIRGECERREISSDRVRFLIGPSHEVLPSWQPRELDLVLVDGAHGFPYPILDWWFLAPHVRVGGRMLLDDAYMPPVAALVDGLRAHRAWAIEGNAGYRTVVVRKLADELPSFDWTGERIGGRMNFRYLAPAERSVAAARHRFFSSRIGLGALSWLSRSGIRYRKRD
jgi:predicted O-methyltransferase YrrM